MGRKLLIVAALVTALAVPALAQNLFLNPSFEIDPVVDGQAPGWAKYRSGDGIDCWLKDWGGGQNLTDWTGVIGHWLPGTWAFWGQSFPCTPGQQVNFTVWSAGYPGFNGSTRPKLEFYGPNQEGGSMALSVVEGDVITGTHLWTPQFANATVPAGAVRVRAMAWVQAPETGTASGSAKFDDAELTSPMTPGRVEPGQVNGLPNNTLVWLKWPVVVKDNGSDLNHTDCYVTGYGREGTCRVISNVPVLSSGAPVAITKGAMLHVVGIVSTIGSEKVVLASDLVPTNWDGPWPKSYNSNSKGIAQISHAAGQTFYYVGKVTNVAGDKTYLYVDDGSGVTGEGGIPGIKVYFDGPAESYPSVNDVVGVTGVAWRETTGSDTYATLTTRTPNDLVVLKVGGTGPGVNVLVNPGFEQGKDPWVTSESVAVEGWAARTGAKGMAFYTWDPYTEAYVYQEVGGIVPGATYQLSGWVKEEVNHVGVIKMRIEWYTAGGALISQTDSTIDPPIDWGQFNLQGVAPATAAKARFLFLDTEHVQGSGSMLAVMVDDAVAKQL